jgi:hypothetical protein
MKGYLVRVGIDLTPESGGWIAPVDPQTHEFAYVPIIENETKGRKRIRSSYEIFCDQFVRPCQKLSKELPSRLRNRYFHLDPDFRFLTYGDEGNKGKQLENLAEGDILAFWAGLSPAKARPRELIYALIGLYVVAKKQTYAKNIHPKDWYKNAHTRRQFLEDDIVVCGRHDGTSGRLERSIRIGGYHDNGYGIDPDIWDAWGGLRGGDRIQRGPHRSFCFPEKFYEWFKKQRIPLVEKNHLP